MRPGEMGFEVAAGVSEGLLWALGGVRARNLTRWRQVPRCGAVFAGCLALEDACDEQRRFADVLPFVRCVDAMATVLHGDVTTCDGLRFACLTDGAGRLRDAFETDGE